MTTITQKGATGPLSLFNQGWAADPALTPQTTQGTGGYDPDIDSLVGSKWDTNLGQTVALVQNGAVAIASGKLLQAPTQDTNHQKLAMTVPTAYPATVGATQILVTNSSTVLKQNIFAGGFLVVASGTGIGQTLQIGSHQAAANGATFVVTLVDALTVALDATSTVSMIQNPYNGVLISNHSTLGTPVGVSLYPMAAGTAPTYDGTSGLQTAAGVAQYGFIVTSGPVGCLIDALTNVGYPVGPSTNTDGALNVATLTSSPQIGISGQTQTSTQAGLVYLQL